MSIAKVAVRTHGGQKYVWYYCPGCKQNHGVPADRWAWNESVESPTLSPSVRHFIPADENRPEKTTCHYHVSNGKIKFCNDCDHELSGKSVEMVEPKSEDVPNDS